MGTDFIWHTEQIHAFIEARSKYKLNSVDTPEYVYQQLISELGLEGSVSIRSAAQLWDSLVTKYKILSQPSLEPEDAAPTSWEFFGAMHNACLSLAPCIMEMQAPQVTSEIGGLQEGHREETVEEEVARLEEVFRNGRIVAIGNVINEEEDDEDDEEEDEEEEDDDEDDDDDEDGGHEEGDEDRNMSLEDISGDEDEEEEDYNQESLKENSHSQINIIDDIWTEDKILKLIELRGQKEGEILSLGQRPVFIKMVEELGLDGQTTPSEARKKWALLVRKYFQIKSKTRVGCEDKAVHEENPDADDDTSGKSDHSWPFFTPMEKVMEKIIKTSPDGGMKSRKSPEFLWSLDITKRFIRLRTEKHSEISIKGHNAVYQEILNDLGLSDRVSVMMARKKWNYLIKRYQDEEIAGGERSWALMKEMDQVMKHFRGSNATKLKSRASPEFLWPNELTKKFIKLRTERHADFVEGNFQTTYTEIMEELGLVHILSPNQLRKKWNYLVAKFKELSCTTGPDGAAPAPHTWPFFEDMEKALHKIPDHLLTTSKFVRVNLENVWTKEVIMRFIQLKGSINAESSKKVSTVFAEIIQQLGLSNQVTPHQARKKWNYLYNKYLDLSHPDVDEFSRQSWPFYSAMQLVVGTLPLAQILHKKSIGDELEDDEIPLKKSNKKARLYVCFMCGKSGKLLNEYFMFEQTQHLLHSQKTVMDIISNLLGKKVINMEATTCLCSRCTNLVNEADSVIYRHERIKEESQQLFYLKMEQAKKEKEGVQKRNHQPSCRIRGDTTNKAMNSLTEANEEELESTVVEETQQKVTYSKRGRKRKSTVMSDSVKTPIKTEPLEDGFESVECEIDFDDDSEEERKRKKARGRGRGRGRGKGRGKRRRGRPATRTTLIGRGLGGQYPNINKRKLLPFKGPKIYHCTECKGEFKKYTELINHRKDVHTVIDTSTLEVKETILENGVITYFNKGKANNSGTSHKCRECDRQFLRKDDLWYHQDIAHTEGKGRAKTAFKDRSYDCEECGERFLFKYKLKMHINSKHLNDAGQNANDFTCGECGCKLGSLPGLTFHMRKHHNKSLTYRKSTEYLCSDCGYMASSNKKLKEHQESHCGSSTKPKVQCEICGKTVLKVSLKMHKVKMHSDFKEQCDRCGERYATKTDLLRHINVVHLRILLYNCQYCGERFPTSDALRYHRVKFHEKPSFYCQVCGKCYKRVGELNTHIKRAHNDRRKAEICQYCNKEYYDRSGLRNHLVNKHNVPQEMTYSENYLRKKRVDGLPLAKHMEKRSIAENKMIAPINQPQPPIMHTQMQSVPQPHMHSQPQQQQPPPPQQQQQPQPQQQPQQQPHPQHHHPQQQQQQIQPQHQPQPHPGHPGGPIVGAHGHLRVVEEAAEAARNLNAYHQDMGNGEDEGSLVVTEITESPQVEQAVLVDPLNVPQGLMHHHPQVAHMQPPMAMHHHMHHQMQHHANMRLNVLYQMNMHHPGPSHLNM